MDRKSLRSSLPLILSAACFLALVAATAYRIQRTYYSGPQDTHRVGLGFSDFFNGVYYPTRAFWARDNPYTPQYAERYPVDRQVPPFSPLVFAIHAPLGWLARDTSAVIYFGWLIMLTLLLAALTLIASRRQVTAAALLAVASFILFSRSGQVSVFSGYFTFIMVIGVVLALHHADKKPLFAGLGVALASCKPAFAIPLVLLLLARRNIKASLVGVAISAFLLGAGLFWLGLDDSYSAAVGEFFQSMDAHRGFPNARPLVSWTRVDLLAIVSKWNDWRPGGAVTLLVMLGVLVAPCGLLLALTRPSSAKSFDTGASGLLGLLCMLAILASVYHQHYDALILLVPTSAMVLRPTGDWNQVSVIHRVLLVGLINAPLLNYLSARAILDRLGLSPGMPTFTMITSVNGICLGIAAIYVAALAWHHRTHSKAVVAAARTARVLPAD